MQLSTYAIEPVSVVTRNRETDELTKDIYNIFRFFHLLVLLLFLLNKRMLLALLILGFAIVLFVTGRLLRLNGGNVHTHK